MSPTRFDSGRNIGKGWMIGHTEINTVNHYIQKCGGDIIPDDPDECWYWTSTEVKDMESDKAWLFSLASGALQETPKEQAHKVRPIITLYN